MLFIKPDSARCRELSNNVSMRREDLVDLSLVTFMY